MLGPRYCWKMSEDVGTLPHELPDAELVFAFVSPLGTPTRKVQVALARALQQHDYEVETVVAISDLLDEMREAPVDERPAQRQERLMETGTALRRTHGGDYIALMAIAAINHGRGHSPKPHRRRAHIIRSLKHPDEVARLRHVYGKGFFLLGVSAPRTLRGDSLIERNFPRDQANRLLDKDAAEEEKIGQQTRDTFELADAFVRIEDAGAERVDAKILRIVDLLMSRPFCPPTREEHAMFMAYAAALRSSDLSRQVGAVVANAAGDVVASGANDVPAPGGGDYWPSGAALGHEELDEAAGPDYRRGYDSNERERNRILAAVISALVPGEEQLMDDSPKARAELVRKYKGRLKGTGVLDLTEFGRAVHAEMAALVACARSGVSPTGGTLYCTTFPCHNCAKHIVAAGIRSVVYVEPYPKSKAKDLHSDSISLPDEDSDAEDGPAGRVCFRAFEGIGPRRFVDLFSLSLGSGRPVRRKAKDADGARLCWVRGKDSVPRLALDARSYMEREDAAAEIFRQEREKCAKSEVEDETNGQV